MRAYYISPSTIPSRSANSIHVVNMCEALSQLEYEVVLFARTDAFFNGDKNQMIGRFYGVSSDAIDLNLCVSQSLKGVELLISFRAFLSYFMDALKGVKPQVIIARNLYAAVLFGIVLRKEVVYETHSPEYGIRKMLQKCLINSSRIYVVVISNALKNVICEFHRVNAKNIYVFHDAARAGAVKLNDLQRKVKRDKLLGGEIELHKYDKIIGYFGHLYPGRGIEVIQGVAERYPAHSFLVYGGNEIEIRKYNENNTISNLFFMGHIPPNLVHNVMEMMDVLLMPYQKSVSIGLAGVDTAQWMSPMKMFEYLSVGIPIISSDLPVLREVLEDGVNSILVTPDDVDEWSAALKTVIYDSNLYDKLGNNAYNLYCSKYTWKLRAENMLGLLR